MAFFFTLLMTSLADLAVLRDGAQEVDAMGRISKSKEANAADAAAPPSATRKELPEQAKAVARSHSDWTAGAVLSQALLDPFALCCLLMIVAYVAFHQLVPVAVKTEVPRRSDFDALSTSSQRSSRRDSQKARAPDRFALVVNQKLTRLDTVDEVFDFVLQSAETGRTDIVNCVTAIHRSAKIMANKPQVERIRVGQDPRLRKLLGQLANFINNQQNAPHILARAVGNTSWALAKLQFREDQETSTTLALLQQVFVQHCAAFRPEEMMNTVWAFAELLRDKDSLPGEERVLAVAQAACRSIDKFPEFTLQQVVYLSWALARMSSITAVKHDSSEVRAGLLDFTQRIVRRTRPEISKLTGKHVAMLSWAAASLHVNLGLVQDECSVTTLLCEIAQLIAQKGLQGFLPGEIASIVWAFNKVHIGAPAFFSAFEQHLLKGGLRGFTSQDISTILGAFAKSRTGSDDLFQLLGDRVTALSKDFNRSEKMLVQWAYEQLPHLTPPKF